MARFSPNKLEEIRARADLIEVLSAHVRLRRAGRNWLGLCPFHEEKTPSFSVNPERGFYHCFGCGAGGSVFDFVMKVEGLSFPEAVECLARRYGITLPPPQYVAGGAPAGEREQLIQANQVAADFYRHVLWKTPEGAAARDYLKARAIENGTAEAFMLGYAPSRPANLAAALGKRSLTAAGLRLGLIKKDERGNQYDMFRARLMFPIRDAQGRVLAFGARVLDGRLPKYINSPESPLYTKSRAVYGLFEARATIAKIDRAIIVEGNIDAIALWQAGFKETVATLGTALTVEQLRLLSRYSRNLIACFDGDGAGRKASVRALEIFLQAGLLGRGAFLPGGFDPDTLVRQRGAAAFGEVLASAELLIDYYVRAQAEAARGSVAAQARAAERVAQLLKAVTNQFEFDLLARKAAESLGVSETLLRRTSRNHEPQSRRMGGERRAAPPPSARPMLDAAAKAEVEILARALVYPEARPVIASLPALDAFQNREALEALTFVCGSDEECQVLLPVLSGMLSDELTARVVSGVAMFDGAEREASAAVFTFKRPEFVELNEQKWKPNRGERRARELEENQQTVDALARVILQRSQARVRHEIPSA